MGVDIHMFLVDEKENKLVLGPDDLFEGRNSLWFANMQQRGDNEAYDYMPVEWCYDRKLPEGCYFKDEDFYGHRSIKLVDLYDWYYRYKPYEDGVYLTEREKWLYESKGIIHEDSLRYYPDEEENATIFTVVSTNDPIVEVVDIILRTVGNSKVEDYTLLWCFDC